MILQDELEQIKNPSSDKRNSLEQWTQVVDKEDSGMGVLNSVHNVSMLPIHKKIKYFNLICDGLLWTWNIVINC